MSNLSDFINTGDGGGGINEIEIKPNAMVMDSIMSDVDAGTAFDIYDTYDFPSTGNGAIWFKFLFPDGFDNAKDIAFDLAYTLNGNDPNKVIRLKAQIWPNDDGDIPTEISPIIDLAEDIISDDTPPDMNIGVVSYKNLSTIKIDSSFLSSNTRIVSFKLIRFTDSANDTYTGTFQLMSVKVRQVEAP